MPPVVAPTARMTLLVLVAVAARAATLGSPLVHADETFYLAVADAMHHGAIPYVDLWDRKPIGLFLLYWPAAIWPLPASLYAYQAMALAAAVATAWLVARLAERAGWRAGAMPAAILYLLWLDLADGQGGQTPVFYNLPVAGAALLALGAGERGDRRRGVAAMLLVGLAMQLKYTVAFEGTALALWLVAADWRRRRSVAGSAAYAAALATTALLPTAMAAAAYATLGHLGDFVFANFVSILLRHGDPPALRWRLLREVALILVPLGLALDAAPREGPTAAQRHAARLARGWLGIALAAFIGFGGWYNHYTLPVMLPGAVCAAAFFERRARSIWWAAAPLALLFVAGQAVLRSEREHRGTPAQFDALVRAVGTGPGGLFVYSGPVLLYPATGRPRLTRWPFPSHLSFAREAGSIGVDQAAEISRIFAARPEAVVMAPPLDMEVASVRAAVEQRLHDDGFVAVPVRLGRDTILAYRRPTSRSSPPAAR